MKSRFILVAVALAVMVAVAWRYYPSPEPEAQAGPPMVEVNVPTLDATAAAGEAAFNERCAVCHGQNAAGKDGVAPPLVHIIYEPNHHADESFHWAAKQGVRAHHWPFGDMPPVEGITDNELVRIIAYVRALQRANGIF
ncbi:MAG: cytochrome c [Rhizobiaceae bacterium]|nr:cytochrome c [Rhizobiaceae bacterium]